MAPAAPPRTPGVHRVPVELSPPALRGWSWPTVEIVGERPGPRLAVWAGMHVNEVSSIEAVHRLAGRIDPALVTGRISLMPVVNLPALAPRTKLECPVDDLNINFQFPGDPEGTFSQAIAWALLNEWAADADCVVDLHGGDFSEDIARYTVVQRTGDERLDAALLAASHCFGADISVELPVEDLKKEGRSCTAAAAAGRLAAFAEAGDNATLSDADAEFHLRGVLRLAAHLGILPADAAPGHGPDGTPGTRTEPRTVTRYDWLPAPGTGWGQVRVRPGDVVEAGQLVLEISDYHTGEKHSLYAPSSGVVMWADLHPAVQEGELVGAIGS